MPDENGSLTWKEAIAMFEAAPDLLEALQRCSDFLEANYDTRDMPDILYPTRAAIAKATGGIAP